MNVKREYFLNAYTTIESEISVLKQILNETHLRPVFGEKLEDHLHATGRKIAYPILLTLSYLRQGGLNEEGLL